MVKLLRFLIFTCAFCSVSLGQLATTTSLVGTVTDASGASAAGVSITATNVETNDSYRTTTADDGNYTIEFIKIGQYTVTAKQPGFQTVVKTGIVVSSNQTVRTDFTLQIGQVSEQVVVTDTTPPLSTDDASVREVVTQQ